MRQPQLEVIHSALTYLSPAQRDRDNVGSTKTCDCCKLHHIMCDGTLPCNNCLITLNTCTFDSETANEDISSMKSALDSLKEDLKVAQNNEKAWKKKYEDALMLSSSKEASSTSAGEKSRKRKRDSTDNIKLVPPGRRSLQRLLGPEQSFVLCNIINNFVSIYETYIHPSHTILPSSNFGARLPEYIHQLIRDDPEDACMNFYVSSLLCNGAMITGNLETSKEFYERSRRYAGDLFDVMDVKVGRAFNLLAYNRLCMGDRVRCISYARLGLSIAEHLNLLTSNLYMNCALGIAFVSSNYEERLKYFRELSRSKAVSDLVFCLSGLVMTEVKFNKEINWRDMSAMMRKCMDLQKSPGSLYHKSQDRTLLDVVTNTAWAMLFRRTGNNKLALEYALNIIHLSEKAEFSYLCVAVDCAALDAAADVFIDQNRTELTRVIQRLDTMSAKFQLSKHFLVSIQSKIKDNLALAVQQEVITHQPVQRLNVFFTSPTEEVPRYTQPNRTSPQTKSSPTVSPTIDVQQTRQHQQHQQQTQQQIKQLQQQMRFEPRHYAKGDLQHVHETINTPQSDKNFNERFYEVTADLLVASLDTQSLPQEADPLLSPNFFALDDDFFAPTLDSDSCIM
ncbi:FCR1 [Acrasis kona]|uniref:FCR1 n=1 Tax=Acrasis kona TaxID=1008807 RepID=A0AAW2ZAE2_9EUKA